MKTIHSVACAIAIGNDYGQLTNFDALPDDASKKDLMMALQLDINDAHQRYADEVKEIDNMIVLISKQDE